ncbi:MAG: helix-turn-helix domain-containing protein [Pseudomonadota bacterium]
MPEHKDYVTSGIAALDEILGGLFIGDNVVWYDDAGSLSAMFWQNFLRSSQAAAKSIIYVSFDRSPKNLMEKLGSLSESAYLTILDCFTYGKGDGSAVFSRFYENKADERLSHIVKVTEPANPDHVMDAIYGLHQTMTDDVRLVFESLTGMQELWGGEDQLLRFYSRSCPKLYELDTIAYWVMEKKAHSDRLKANINQIAQVAIDLSLRRGRSLLTVLKAENRLTSVLHKPHLFWSDDLQVHFETEKKASGKIDVGSRLKEIRTGQGISQKDLAKWVGVTPSTISQIESNTIYPSLPALFKIAETLSVDAGSLFSGRPAEAKRRVFHADGGTDAVFHGLPKQSISGRLLTAPDSDLHLAAYLIDIEPGAVLPSHFFNHKGEEIGFVIGGKIQFTIKNQTTVIAAGDMVHLTDDVPSQWKNMQKSSAKLFWINIARAK